MSVDFIHLRIHSEFSLVDGIVKIKPLMSHLTQLAMPAVALTEQSNLFSLVKFIALHKRLVLSPSSVLIFILIMRMIVQRPSE